MTMYYMLIERHDNGKWGPAFGDYDLEVVKDELQDYRDNGKRKRDLAIIAAEDTSEALGEALERFKKARAGKHLSKESARMMRGQ